MKKEVLDKGFVELVDRMGDDYSILQAARTSTGSEVIKGDVKDRGLIRYLYRNEHMTPFEFVQLKFHVKCPIFVGRQWFRHRAATYNEASARYQQFEWEVFLPEEWRAQDIEDKQSSYGHVDHQELTTSMVDGIYRKSHQAYDSMVGHGVAKEQARIVMPVGQYTEFFTSISLRNLFHFLELRMDPHAQYEIRVYANAIYDIISEIEELKWSIEVFNDVRNLKMSFKQAMNKAFKNNSIDELEEHLKKYGN